MQYDIWKFIALLSVAAILGYSLGHTFLVMLLVALGIIVWQIFRLDTLYRWVEKPRDNPMPEVSGQLYLLYRSLNRKSNKSAKRKRQLTSFLSQFRKAVGALPDAIVLIDERGKIEWANANAKTVLGIRWPGDSAVKFSDLIRHPEVEAHIEAAGKLDAPVAQGVVVNSLSNNEQILNIKCVRYTEKLRMIVARDVSRLIQINQMQRDFVANVSHELKTPLTVLKGYVEILQGTEDVPQRFRKPLEQMRLQGERMQFIVNDLLYLAKLEDNATLKPSERVDVTHIVNTIVESVQPLIKQKRHKLELDIDYNLVISGAQTELHSAFSNLITNAINYTPDNGYIRVHWHANDGGAIFSVKDDGLGIAANHIERLTQRFYRVDTDRSRDGGGTGLGLAIVKHVLQRHGAELEILSELGAGSEFRCKFPQQLSLKDTQALTNAHASGGAQNQSGVVPKTLF